MNGQNHVATTAATTFANQEYDYLVLGGGTAGLTIAARLSESPDVKVGVIEAGKSRLNDMLVDVPAMFLQMFGNPEYDWKYSTTPQIGPDSKTLEHHVVRGKMLGGSSGINYMMYVRGSAADYDDWAKITGDDGWSHQNMNRYMRKHQTLEPIDDSVTDRSTMPFVSENHGISGPIHTSFNPWKLDIEDDVVKTADKVTGYNKKPKDPWSGDHIGFYHTLAAIGRNGSIKGKRSYAARGFYEPNAERNNLKVTTNALVTRILLDGNRATGASFICDGQEYTVKAKREIIVCAGAIGSPQLLELSGIGDPDILRTAGVECKIENRGIGENFQDHIVAGLTYETPGQDTLDATARPEVIQHAMKQYQESATGPLATTSTVQGFLPIKRFVTRSELEHMISSIESIEDQTEYSRKQRETVIAHIKDDHSANLQIILVAATANCTETSQVDQSQLFPPLKDTNGTNGITLACCLQYPVSRGSVHIRTANAKDQPAIDPGYFRHEADMDQLVVGMRFLDQLSQTEPLKSKLGKRLHPRADLDLSKTEDCRQGILDWYMSEYHLCGSVAAGDALDSKLKVKGAEGLRVVDASCFAGNVSGNIMASVYALAERAADLIKEDWNHASLKNGA